jgi:hypothetical protein
MPVLAPAAPVISPETAAPSVRPVSCVPPLYVAVASWWQDRQAVDGHKCDEGLCSELGDRAYEALTRSRP